MEEDITKQDQEKRISEPKGFIDRDVRKSQKAEEDDVAHRGDIITNEMQSPTNQLGATNASSRKQRAMLSVDYRLICLLLLLIIVIMLALWRPWEDIGAKDARSIAVTGTTTLKAEPDEFVFNPTYSFTSEDRNQAISELTKKSEEIIKKLTELGVPKEKIKVDVDNNTYEFSPYIRDQQNKNKYYLRMTITAGDKTKSQKVQDYLTTTAPEGNVSPKAAFSRQKQIELENKARDAATKDARAKADQSAKNLGFAVGKVKSVNDGSLGYPGPLVSSGVNSTSGAEDMKAANEPSMLNVMPGENELSYTVHVEYYIR